MCARSCRRWNCSQLSLRERRNSILANSRFPLDFTLYLFTRSIKCTNKYSYMMMKARPILCVADPFPDTQKLETKLAPEQ